MPLVYPSQSGYSQSPQSVPAIASRTTLYSSSFERVCARGGPWTASAGTAEAGAPELSDETPGAPGAGAAGAGTTPDFRETRIVSSIAFESAPPGAHFSGL